MKRAEIQWTGAPVTGLAVTVLHFPDAKTDIRGTIESFITELRTSIPTNVTLTHTPSGDVLEEDTGILTGVWSEAGGPVSLAGTSGGVAAAGVGGCIGWLTSGIVNGHRVRGRTFVVPLATAAYEANGTLTTAALGDLDAAAGVMVTGGLQVWHRPTGPGGSDGSAHDVVNHTVRDKVAVLTSRRD